LGKYLKTADTDWYKQRLIRVMLCVSGAFFILLIRLFYLQVVQGQELRRLSENNCIRLQSTDASRGMIFDRNGILLVDNRPAFDLSIILKDAKPVDRTIEKLAKLVKVPVSELMKKIGHNKGISCYKPILLKQDIGRDALAAVEVRKFDLPGIVVDVKPRRHYIKRQSAAHLIGYLSEINSGELKSGKHPECKGGDFIGKFGVEKGFEGFLKGKRGGRQVEVNVMGQVVKVLKTVDALPGQNIYLTIDYILQKKAEALLEGTAGAVVAMDPETGDILVMASSPSFDQNAFVDGMSHKQWESLISNPLRPMENKAVQGEYPPASTFKIVTAIAGLEEGVIDENTIMHCPGYYKYGNRIYRCWRRGGHGSVNIVKALSESCDVFFYQVGQKLGIDRLAFYAKAWYDLSTPLQMLVLTSAFANGGTRYKPLILKSVKTADGDIVIQSKKQVMGRLPAGKKTLSIVKKGLREVVNSPKGTGWIAHIKGIDISGKTGTAQIVGRKNDSNLSEKDLPDHFKAHAWFVAYAPSVNSQIAVAVLVEHGEHGSSAAAPIAREIIRTYLEKDEYGRQLKAEISKQ